jgi:hypothetical protein
MDRNMSEEWPFRDSPEVEALASARVMNGEPILLVTHDAADGGWQFLCGSTDRAVEVRAVELGELVSRDSSLCALADLPLGWRAWRATARDSWQRGPLGLGP